MKKIDLDEIKLTEYYEKWLTQIIVSMFEYENLPPGLESKHINEALCGGHCIIAKMPDGTYFSGPCNFTGELDYYGIMTEGFAIALNGIQSEIKPLNKPGTDSHTLIWANSLHSPILDIRKVSKELAEIDKSLRCNVLNSRLAPIVVAKNSKMKSLIDGVLSNIKKGKPQSIVNDSANKDIVSALAMGGMVKDSMEIPILNLTDVTASDKINNLTMLKEFVLRIFTTKYGVNINTPAKKAQQTVDEINGYDEFSAIIPLDMYKNIKEGMDMFNKINGFDVKVKFTEVWAYLLKEELTDEELIEMNRDDLIKEVKANEQTEDITAAEI